MKLTRTRTIAALIATLVAGGAAAQATAPVTSAPPAATDHATAKPARRVVVKGKAGAHPKSDFIALGTTTVTGNRELPKVMYIVPWKKSDIGDMSGKPVNSLLDEVLAPIDRDVFRRQILYYHALATASPQNGGAPATQGEK